MGDLGDALRSARQQENYRDNWEELKRARKEIAALKAENKKVNGAVEDAHDKLFIFAASAPTDISGRIMDIVNNLREALTFVVHDKQV